MNISKINSVSYVTRNNIGYNVGNDNNRVENNNENNLNKNISFGNFINYYLALFRLKFFTGNIETYLHDVVGKYAKLDGLTNDEIILLHNKASRYLQEKDYNKSCNQSLTIFEKIKKILGF